MKAFIALIRRELLEHRGAFVIAPLALLVVLFGSVLAAYFTGRLSLQIFGVMVPSALRVFELSFLAFGFAWWLYLLGVLFFYCSDAFSADRKNNSMLFWKSMPQSDLKILLSKLVAALTLLPFMVYLAALLSGVLVYGVAIIVNTYTGGYTATYLGATLYAYGQIAGALGLIFGLSLLWFMPYLAWIGALSTLVGRWSVPLSILIPGLAIMIENLFAARLMLDGGQIYRYLSYRSDFRLTQDYLETWITTSDPFDLQTFATGLIGRMDWTAIGTGAVFALIVMIGASEWRRRVIS